MRTIAEAASLTRIPPKKLMQSQNFSKRKGSLEDKVYSQPFLLDMPRVKEDDGSSDARSNILESSPASVSKLPGTLE